MKLYWQGNAAKTRILAEILPAVQERGETLIFDYGCGDGGDWPSVLRDYPNIKLFGYEPHGPSFQKAQAKLKGMGAALISGDEIRDFRLAADYIVSFSVLEHVYDRRAYMAKAKALLGPQGRFYLNYDDGHFRNTIDLSRTGNWREVFREWKVNRSAGLRVMTGKLSGYQKRVTTEEMGALVSGADLEVLDSRYDNLLALKTLARSIPPERKDSFVRFWLEVEQRLNAEFLVQGKEVMGDSANLWTEMVSKTLVLGHRSPKV